MSLIIKDKLQMMIVGFPTVSDKYNITGGLLSGTSPVSFGDLVMHDGSGYYKKVASASSIADIAGFVLGTNVKLAEGFATNVVQVNPGEAFNLVLPGSYLAIKVGGISAGSDITPNKQLYVDLSDGSVTISSSSTVALPGVVLTGTWEKQGSDYVCEILVK